MAIKRCLMLISFMCSLITIVACSSDDSKTTPELIVTESQLDFTNQGGDMTFNFKCTTDWTISSSADWCSVDQMSGQAVTRQMTVHAMTNPNAETRTTELTVMASGLTKVVQINQQASYTLSLNSHVLDASPAGEVLALGVTSATEYQVTTDAPWITISTQDGSNESSLTLTIARNPFLDIREGHVRVTAGPLTEEVTVTQNGNVGNDVASQTMRDALTIASYMTLGWNVGNTLEAYNDGQASETAWGNPKVNQVLISAVKQAGFNAVRIPCAWDGYIVDQSTYRISEDWLERVKEVVDYCLTEDMYAIINIHWDGGWLENQVSYDKQEAITKKEAAIWQQIAVYFRDYGDHLLFAGNNEVHDGYGTPTDENLAVQASYNQVFVDAVRGTKGNNLLRTLIVQSYNTNIAYAVDYLTMPTDVASNRLMAEVHYYDPWDFCGDDPSIKYWGHKYEAYGTLSSYGQEDYLAQKMKDLKTAFVDQHIPVILGEFNAFLQYNLTGDEAIKNQTCRDYYLQMVVTEALKNGVVPFYWDAGGQGSALFNRKSGVLYDQAAQSALDAMLLGVDDAKSSN